MQLHDYSRSGAGFRVRIALNLKGLVYDRVPHDLRIGAQREAAYRKINPQGLVPALEVSGFVISQSSAIIEWLEERFPFPSLLPQDIAAKAIVRAMAAIVSTDIHPLNNLRVLNRLRSDFQGDESVIQAWAGNWIREGFQALEQMIIGYGGQFAFGDSATIADCCLVPQCYSAQRFGIDLSAFPSICAVVSHCTKLPAFVAAHPDNQSDT